MDLSEVSVDAISKVARHPWELARTDFIIGLMRKLEKHSPRQILDIGCGDCFLLERIARTFPHWELTGVDTAINDTVVEQIRCCNPQTRLQLFSDLNQVQQTFDVISLCDVIEHIPEPDEFLQQLIAKHLNPHGHLLITVPAFNSLFSDHDQKLKHFRRYRRSQLVSFAQKHQLKTVSSGYFFASLLLPRVLQKILRRQSAGAAAWNHGPTVTRMVKSVLNSDAACCRLLSNFKLHLPGLSCYLIARKQ